MCKKRDNMEKEWYKCPNCKQKLMKYDKDAISSNVYIKCKKCKKEIEIKFLYFDCEQ